MIGTDHVREQIKDFILKNSAVARRRRIADEDPLLEEGILDSLGVLDLLGFLETTFGIGFDDEELVPEHFQTVARIATCVERKLAEQPGRSA